MKIFVDSDSCPVKQEIMQIAQTLKIKTYFVSTECHFFVVESNSLYYQWVCVDQVQDRSDIYIANHIQPGDIVITQDYGLASLVLGKRACVMTFRGRRIDHDNIEFLLFKKSIHSKIFRSACKLNGEKVMNEEDRELFAEKLNDLLISLKKEGDYS